MSHVPDTPAHDPWADLNPRQREAVEYGTGADAERCGPLLVIAGAGSGKTSTLAHRVANLVLKGADPHRILLLTFSRRAAIEMERRAGRVMQAVLGLGGQPPSLPWAGTFHAIGARLLRDYATRIGLSEAFTIHDRGDAEDLMGFARHELGFSGTKSRFPLKGTCLAIYSRAVNSQAPLHGVLARHFPWCAQWEEQLKTLFGSYVQAKQDQHVLDYDDLLLYWAEMTREPAIAAELGATFDHVLVDEYQDTNRLQAQILLAMKPDGRGLTVVGDDAQSIYSFRAATVRNILDFPSQFSRPAHVVTLDRNYRSTQPILDASNAVIAEAPERHAKQLWTDRASAQRPQLVYVSDEPGQARWVADQILARRETGVRLMSQAVLFRSASHSAGLELELTRRNIPFVKFGGLKFLEAAHVKDVLALLRWAANPLGRLSGFRVAQLMPGIGPANAARLLDAMAESGQAVQALAGFSPPAAAAEDWKVFADTFVALSDPGLAWPAHLDLALRWYGPHLQRLYDDAVVRQADLDQLARIAGTYGSREQFLTELTLDPPDATSAQSGQPLLDEDYLILSTIHSAKGQEWKAVYVLNVVDGCIPSDMSTGDADEIEEERRLLYVAMTRAKEDLQLVVPQRFYVHQQSGMGDRHVYGTRSRFIPERMLPLFEILPKARQGAPAAAPAQPAVRVDIASRMRNAWR
ncbi:ATP-dependent helicase [Pigmentiphaga kullae]|uniref:DNA 3'-5' helicase n=1 Tax=Pigmentiphaga kullae TaxID=151784 RepID=A0A4Q7NEW6_9BURK|nr:ATP-dependent helicase [Pigmentiphaga kullae]RZS81606.1 DNA helicase-2/ATP-dependent DNA helicase PcrA [Pigmentiphaga kullae]